jgi:signal transduction histidine kinase
MGESDMETPRLRVLLIEDDEDDYVLIRTMLSKALPSKHELEWVTSYDAALEAIKGKEYDVCLLDYRLGERNGLEFLQESLKHGCRVPIILLTGYGGYEVDIETMKAGAADYLVKDQLNSPLLERAIRYALERRRTEEVLRESESRLRHLSSELLNAQEKERKLIALELHDSIVAKLAAVKFGLEQRLTQVRNGTIQGTTSLEDSVHTLKQIIDETRRIMSNLRPSMIDDLGILPTINWHCREFQKIYETINIEKQIDIEEEEVPDNLKIVIFRIIQEAMNNIGKHSGAAHILVSLQRITGAIELVVEDNGRGFNSGERNSSSAIEEGIGLGSMKERSSLSGGSFSIESIEGKGTCVRVRWHISRCRF